jgi:hypothetical protein
MGTRTRNPKRRSRRRQRQEGSALIQAIIVGLVMLVTLCCVLMFARAYDAKVMAGVLARDAAWATGLDGCPADLRDNAGETAALAENPDQGIAADLVNAFFKLSPATQNPGDTSAQAPRLLGGEVIGFQTVTQFACNEEPRTEGDLISGGEWAFDLVSDIFF